VGTRGTKYKMHNIQKIHLTIDREIFATRKSPGHRSPSFPLVPPRSNRGVTILELLIYIAILSGLMVIISDAFIMLSSGRGQAEARSEVNSALRFSGELIKQDIKNATAISSPVLGTASSTLSLTVAGAPVVYDVLSGAFRRTANGVVSTTTGATIVADTPAFTRLENYNPTLGATTTAVQIAITMRYNASTTDFLYSDTLRTTATFR